MKNTNETKTCPACQSEISARARKCPKCQEDMRSWFRKHPILTFLAVIMLLPTLTGLFTSSGNSKPSSVNNQKTPVSQPRNTLGQKIRNRYSSDGETVMVNGYEIRVGEQMDSVFKKLGKSAINSVTENDSEYGLIVEHQYDKYTILGSREPNNQAYYIVWDIYPNDTNTSSHSPTPSSRDDFKADVTFIGTQFVITNLDTADCISANMEINGGWFKDGYSLKGYTLKVGETYEIGVGQFTQKDGTRFNSLVTKPKDLFIECQGENELQYASWLSQW